GRVKLRVINGASATVFWIDTGELSARLVAVDGHAVQPLEGKRFGVAMGQRLDLELELAGDGAWPVLALREGAKQRTGLILATSGAT
ncbi:copper oxidase, partial [Klebsiella pneumoniae]